MFRFENLESDRPNADGQNHGSPEQVNQEGVCKDHASPDQASQDQATRSHAIQSHSSPLRNTQANGCLWVSQTTAGRKNCLRFEVAGTDGAMAWNSEEPNSLWCGHRDTPNQILTRDPSLLSAEAAKVTNYPGGHNEGFPDTFKQLFRSFYGYIAQGNFTAPCPFPTFADGHHEILLCEAVQRSGGTWVSVDSEQAD